MRKLNSNFRAETSSRPLFDGLLTVT